MRCILVISKTSNHLVPIYIRASWHAPPHTHIYIYIYIYIYTHAHVRGDKCINTHTHRERGGDPFRNTISFMGNVTSSKWSTPVLVKRFLLIIESWLNMRKWTSIRENMQMFSMCTLQMWDKVQTKIITNREYKSLTIKRGMNPFCSFVVIVVVYLTYLTSALVTHATYGRKATPYGNKSRRRHRWKIRTHDVEIYCALPQPLRYRGVENQI